MATVPKPKKSIAKGNSKSNIVKVGNGWVLEQNDAGYQTLVISKDDPFQEYTGLEISNTYIDECIDISVPVTEAVVKAVKPKKWLTDIDPGDTQD